MAAKRTGPLSNLSNDDTHVLIDLIHRHPVVWDTRNRNYRDSDTKNSTWATIRTIFERTTTISCEDQHVKTKWESLRASFSREYRKVLGSVKSGAGAAEIFTSAWPFYKAMSFCRSAIAIDNYITENLNQSQLADTDEVEDGPSLEILCSDEDMDAGNNDSLEHQHRAFGQSSSSASSSPYPRYTSHKDDVQLQHRTSSQSSSSSSPPAWAPLANIQSPVTGCSRKRASSPDPLSACITKLMEAKVAKSHRDDLTIWSENLVSSMRDLNLKRRRRLRLAIDSLLLKAMEATADSEDEKE